jgi:hypothetical protein
MLLTTALVAVVHVSQDFWAQPLPRQTELLRLESPAKTLAKRPLLQTELAQNQGKLLSLARKKLSMLAKSGTLRLTGPKTQYGRLVANQMFGGKVYVKGGENGRPISSVTVEMPAGADHLRRAQSMLSSLEKEISQLESYVSVIKRSKTARIVPHSPSSLQLGVHELNDLRRKMQAGSDNKDISSILAKIQKDGRHVRRNIGADKLSKKYFFRMAAPDAAAPTQELLQLSDTVGNGAVHASLMKLADDVSAMRSDVHDSLANAAKHTRSGKAVLSKLAAEVASLHKAVKTTSLKQVSPRSLSSHVDSLASEVHSLSSALRTSLAAAPTATIQPMLAAGLPQLPPCEAAAPLQPCQVVPTATVPTMCGGQPCQQPCSAEPCQALSSSLQPNSASSHSALSAEQGQQLASLLKQLSSRVAQLTPAAAAPQPVAPAPLACYTQAVGGCISAVPAGAQPTACAGAGCIVHSSQQPIHAEMSRQISELRQQLKKQQDNRKEDLELYSKMASQVIKMKHQLHAENSSKAKQEKVLKEIQQLAVAMRTMKSGLQKLTEQVDGLEKSKEPSKKAKELDEVKHAVQKDVAEDMKKAGSDHAQVKALNDAVKKMSAEIATEKAHKTAHKAASSKSPTTGNPTRAPVATPQPQVKKLKAKVPVVQLASTQSFARQLAAEVPDQVSKSLNGPMPHEDALEQLQDQENKKLSELDSLSNSMGSIANQAMGAVDGV